MNESVLGQSLPSFLKMEDTIYPNKHPQVKLEYSPYNDKDENISRESEADCNINNDFDSKSIKSTSTNKSKRPPNQDDLCKAILTLRNKLPQRSLQQVIIRLYQSIDHRKRSDGISQISKKSREYQASEYSRRDDFDDSKSLPGSLTFNENYFEGLRQQQFSKGTEQSYTSMKNGDDSMKLKSNNQGIKKMENYQSEISKNSYGGQLQNEQIPEAGIHYIYKPRGQEVVVFYPVEKTRKVNFINIEEQTRYIERRVMAKSFIERGYGVSQCRKQIEAQNLTIEMHRNTYKTLAGSVIILAFRKLQSFIANECHKTIKYLDRWQMRSICTTMLNCRTNMQPEPMQTLFKYIKAGYGLEDVKIGQIESVKLYLAILKHIHGKNVTMETLERMGQIQIKKNMQLTHEYLNRKKQKREQRLEKLRKLRIEVKQQKRKDREIRRHQTYQILSQIQLNHPQIKYQAMIEASSTENNENVKQQHDNTMNDRQRQHSVSQASEAEPSPSKEELCWKQQFDIEFISTYLESKNMLNTITSMQQKHADLINWSIELFQKRFCKIIKKSVKKVQVQSQMSEDPSLPILNKLEKDQFRRLFYSSNAQNVRNQLFAYFLLDEPNLEMLIQVVAITNIFFYGFPQGCPPGERKRGRGRPPSLLKRQSSKQGDSSCPQDYEKGYFSYNPAYGQDGSQINFEQQFVFSEQQLRTLGQSCEQAMNMELDFDLDIQTNELRLDNEKEGQSIKDINENSDKPQSYIKIQDESKYSQR